MRKYVDRTHRWPYFLWKLRISDQETGDATAVEEPDEGVDFRIHDWLSHQRQRAVLDCQTFFIALRLHSRDAWKTGHEQRGSQNEFWSMLPTQTICSWDLQGVYSAAVHSEGSQTSSFCESKSQFLVLPHDVPCSKFSQAEKQTAAGLFNAANWILWISGWRRSLTCSSINGGLIHSWSHPGQTSSSTCFFCISVSRKPTAAT